MKKGGNTSEPDWIVKFWNWWSENVSHSVWFRTLVKIGQNVKWIVTSIFDFIWYVLMDIVKYGIRSGWFIFISTISSISLIDSMALAGDFGVCTTTASPVCFNFYASLWGCIQAFFSMLGNITYQLILLILPSPTFMLIASSIILSLVTTSFLIIYQHELLEDAAKEKKTKTKENKENKAKDTKESKKGGAAEKVSRMFHKDVLSKINDIPKEKMDLWIEKHPLPFGVALLFGYIQETEKGYKMTQESLDRIQTNVQNSVTTLKKDGEVEVEDEVTEKDIHEIQEIFQAMDLLNIASIHSLAREALEPMELKKGGALPFENQMSSLTKEDMDWLQETYPPGFKIAKEYGVVDDQLQFTEASHQILQTHLRHMKSILHR